MQMLMKHLRERRKWSQARLAREAQLCQSTLSQIENGRFVPYDTQLSKLANALDWKGDPNDLLLDQTTNEDIIHNQERVNGDNNE